jgi:hypothetical protein
MRADHYMTRPTERQTDHEVNILGDIGVPLWHGWTNLAQLVGVTDGEGTGVVAEREHYGTNGRKNQHEFVRGRSV